MSEPTNEFVAMIDSMRGARWISWAQNGEDVLLRRCFDERPGFYINIGANHPTVGSATRHFFDLGWRGIDVEPLPGLNRMLREARPGNIVLEMAVSDREGEMRLHRAIGISGLSTFSDEAAAQHRARGVKFDEITVHVTTLAKLCEAHCDPAVPIEFLQIDVECHEKQVLAGADFSRWRPKVVVIEALWPSTQTPTHAEWEPLLVDAGYLYASFDGLNRYYVAREHADLVARLAVPPNLFDHFVDHTWLSSLQLAIDTALRAPDAKAELARMKEALARLEAHTMW
jgi:FkbM family methyltransferase